MADLPPGFVLDQPQTVAPPPGFQLDGPDTRSVIARTLSPRRENFPEYTLGPMDAGRENRPLEERALLSEFDRKGGDVGASIGKDRYGNPTIITNRGTFYLERPGLDPKDISDAQRAAGAVVHEAAPYLAAGVATGGTTWIPAVATQMATGLAKESIDQAGNAMQGKPVEYSKLATTPLWAGAGEAAGRVVFAVMRPVFRSLFGAKAPSNLVNSNGTLTDDALKALDDAQVPADQLDDLAQQELRRMQQHGVLTREQAERFNFFKNQGIEPTRAQITRAADDFQLQQEAAKTSTGVRAALEGQEQQISQAFDTTIRGTGGNATTSGSPISDAVLNKASQLDAEISRLYTAAREATNGEKVIGLNQMAQNLRARAPDNELTGGLIRSIRGDLMERGVMDKNWRVVGKIDVNTAETVRQVLNQRWNSTNDYGRILIRQLKDSLDADVLRTAGDDIFQEARRAKAAFESGLRPEALSKFDVNERSLVRHVLENRIKADDVFDQAVLSKSWKASDLRELRNYLTRGSQQQTQTGLQAWNDLRAETAQWIKDQAFSNALDQGGNASMRSGAIRRSLDKIGPDRLSVLFNAEERQFLNNMTRLEQLRQPVPLTGNGKGPSAQAIGGLVTEIRRQAAKLPVIGQIMGGIIDAVQNNTRAVQALSSPIPQAVNAATEAAARRAVVTPAGAVGAVTGSEIEDRLR